MKAVIERGGKQYRVREGEIIEVEKLDKKKGAEVKLEKVLLVEKDGEVKIGRPLLEGALVIAEVVDHGRGDKIIVYKYKRRKGYHRKYGHRQPYTRLKIKEIRLEEKGERRKGEPAPE